MNLSTLHHRTPPDFRNRAGTSCHVPSVTTMSLVLVGLIAGPGTVLAGMPGTCDPPSNPLAITTKVDLAHDSISIVELISSVKEKWQFNMTELADILGVTRPTVYSWLKGKTSPDPQSQKHLQTLAAAATDWTGATAGSNWDFLLDYTGPRADQTTIRETLRSADVSVDKIREVIQERMKQYQEAYAQSREILGEPAVIKGEPIRESTRKLNKRWADNAKKLHRFRNSFS
jgi:DNA-binding transcriptional regulator YiaG